MQPITNFFPTDDRNVASSQLKVSSSVDSVRAIGSLERVSDARPMWVASEAIIGGTVPASNRPTRFERTAHFRERRMAVGILPRASESVEGESPASAVSHCPLPIPHCPFYLTAPPFALITCPVMYDAS